MEMPSQKEQRIAERYVLEHKLERPDTDAKKAVKCFCIFMIMSFLFAVLSFHIATKFFYSISKSAPSHFQDILLYYLYRYYGSVCFKKGRHWSNKIISALYI